MSSTIFTFFQLFLSGLSEAVIGVIPRPSAAHDFSHLAQLLLLECHPALFVRSHVPLWLYVSDGCAKAALTGIGPAFWARDLPNEPLTSVKVQHCILSFSV